MSYGTNVRKCARNCIYAILFLSIIARSTFADPRLIGVSAPLSGAGEGWGNDVKNVLIFANEKLADGQYKFVFEDDRCDVKTSILIAQKLSSVDHVHEVLVVCGQTVLATAARYHAAGVTVMASLATPSRISDLGVFRTSLSDALAARKLAQYVAARHQEIFVLTEENDYPVGFLNDFMKSAAEFKLSVQSEHFNPEQQDFRPLLLKLKGKNVQAIFLNTQTEGSLTLLVKQLAELGMTPKLYGAYLPGSADFLRMGGQFANGLVFVDFPGAMEFLNPEGKKLFAEYTARFGPLHGWSFAFPSTFEAFRAMHMAISSGQSVEKYLHETSFDGIFGHYTFDVHGDVIGPHHVIRVIQNGKTEIVPE